MVCNIPCINSYLNMYQCNIHLCHGGPKCNDWFYSHGLGLWFQMGPSVFCCSQICHGELYVLKILDWSGSYGADLESKLLVLGKDRTLLLDIWDWLLRDMGWNVSWIFEWHVWLNLVRGGVRVPAGTWSYSSEDLVSDWKMPHYQGCEDWVDVHL